MVRFELMTWSIDNRVNQNSLDLDIETKLSLAGLRFCFKIRLHINLGSNWSLISLLWSISIPFSTSIPKVKARVWCIFSLCKFPSLIQFIAVPPRRRGGRRSRHIYSLLCFFIIEWILRLARKKCNKEVKILELSTFSLLYQDQLPQSIRPFYAYFIQINR